MAVSAGGGIFSPAADLVTTVSAQALIDASLAGVAKYADMNEPAVAGNWGFWPNASVIQSYDVDFSPTVGRTYYWPVTSPIDRTIDGVIFDVESSAAGTCEFALQELDADWANVGTVDYGSAVSTATTGHKSSTGWNWTLEAGKMYWVLMNASAGFACQRVRLDMQHQTPWTDLQTTQMATLIYAYKDSGTITDGLAAEAPGVWLTGKDGMNVPFLFT